jgi:hypothetical protein
MKEPALKPKTFFPLIPSSPRKTMEKPPSSKGINSEYSRPRYLLFEERKTARRNEEALWELLISLAEEEVTKLQQGRKIQIGVISFVDEPVVITLQAVKDDRSVRRSKTAGGRK